MKAQWLNMDNKLFKEKAYKLLYEQYSKLYTNILYRARNTLQYGQKEDQVKVLQTVIDTENYHSSGLQNKEDTKLVEALEYLLDDSEPVK